jgi:hypothetical protein
MRNSCETRRLISFQGLLSFDLFGLLLLSGFDEASGELSKGTETGDPEICTEESPEPAHPRYRCVTLSFATELNRIKQA